MPIELQVFFNTKTVKFGSRLEFKYEIIAKSHTFDTSASSGLTFPVVEPINIGGKFGVSRKHAEYYVPIGVRAYMITATQTATLKEDVTYSTLTAKGWAIDKYARYTHMGSYLNYQITLYSNSNELILNCEAALKAGNLGSQVQLHMEKKEYCDIDKGVLKSGGCKIDLLKFPNSNSEKYHDEYKIFISSILKALSKGKATIVRIDRQTFNDERKRRDANSLKHIRDERVRLITLINSYIVFYAESKSVEKNLDDLSAICIQLESKYMEEYNDVKSITTLEAKEDEFEALRERAKKALDAIDKKRPLRTGIPLILSNGTKHLSISEESKKFAKYRHRRFIPALTSSDSTIIQIKNEYEQFIKPSETRYIFEFCPLEEAFLSYSLFLIYQNKSKAALVESQTVRNIRLVDPSGRLDASQELTKGTKVLVSIDSKESPLYLSLAIDGTTLEFTTTKDTYFIVDYAPEKYLSKEEILSGKRFPSQDKYNWNLYNTMKPDLPKAKDDKPAIKSMKAAITLRCPVESLVIAGAGVSSMESTNTAITYNRPIEPLAIAGAGVPREETPPATSTRSTQTFLNSLTIEGHQNKDITPSVKYD